MGLKLSNPNIHHHHHHPRAEDDYFIQDPSCDKHKEHKNIVSPLLLLGDDPKPN